MLYKPGDYPTVTPQTLGMAASGVPDAMEILSLAVAFAWWREFNKRKNSLPRNVAGRKSYKIRNREALLAKQREYNMRPEVVARRVQFVLDDKAKNPEKYKKRNRDKFARNKDKIYARIKRYLDSNPTARLAARLRTHLGNTLKRRNLRGTGAGLQMLVGCSMEQLKAHLESRFKPGMTWQNWTRDGWHIDHIRPLASFDLTIESERIAAFHYSNLKPEWADSNMTKSSTYNGKRWTYRDHLASCMGQM